MTELTKSVEQRTAASRSAWGRGVGVYVDELLEELQEHFNYNKSDLTSVNTMDELNSILLNGARDWSAYSYGGCSLIYDSDIAERLSTASELKRNKHGDRRPNSREEWLDTQARALYQAASIIKGAFKRMRAVKKCVK